MRKIFFSTIKLIVKLEFLALLCFFAVVSASANADKTESVVSTNQEFKPEVIVINYGFSKKISIIFDSINSSNSELSEMEEDIKETIIDNLSDIGLFSFYADSAFHKISRTFLDLIKNDPETAQIRISLSEDDELINVELSLYSTARAQNLLVKKFTLAKEEGSRIPAKISDLIFSYYTGLEGFYDTTFFYVAEEYKDGRKIKKIASKNLGSKGSKIYTNGRFLVMTPRVSPDKRKMVYLSYVDSIPTLHIYDFTTKLVRKLTSLPGMSFAPRFSRDGKKVVFVTAFNGNSEIMILDLETEEIFRITHDYSIDTSPDFSPNGKEVIFSSDRSGRQELYLVELDGSNLRKIEIDNANYANPVWSPDGKYIAYTRIKNNKFSIGVLNLKTLENKNLTVSYKDESPSWSQNSKYIIFTRKTSEKNRLRSDLYLVSLNGSFIKKITLPHEATDPFWVN